MTVDTGTESRRSAEGGRGEEGGRDPKSRGGAPGRDGVTCGGSTSAGEAERQRAIDEVQAQMEWEQQEELQVWAQAIMVTQGGGMPGPSTVVAGPIARTCEHCVGFLRDPEGCMVSEKGKVWACMSCKKAHKACVWPLGPGDAATAMGSRTKGSGKLVPKQLRKRAERAAMNTLPRGGEKHKKVCMMTEEGEEDEDTEEVFGVPRAMVEEQRDAEKRRTCR